MYSAGHAYYQSQAVETAGPAQLVLMLYEGALAAMSRARIGAGSIERVSRELLKAQDIVGELLVTLDHRQGGDIALNLDALYRFCIERMVEANLTKDLTLLDGAESVLTGLRDAWQSACCQMAAP